MGNAMSAMSREERDALRKRQDKVVKNHVVIDLERRQIRFMANGEILRTEPYEDLKKVEIAFSGEFSDFRMKLTGKPAGSIGRHCEIPDLIGFPVPNQHSR